MAKKKLELSKSDAIRNLKSQNQDIGPKAIAETLGKEGYKVSAQFVSTVLSNDRRKMGKVGRRGRPSSNVITGKDVLVAKDLVEQVGGIENAKKVLELYGQIVK